MADEASGNRYDRQLIVIVPAHSHVLGLTAVKETMKRFSIIVPAHNEANTIIPLLEAVRTATAEISTVSFEVIVIDDGSRDATRSLLLGTSALYDHLVLLDQQHGKGGAVLKGLQRASGDYVLFQDADLEYNPQDYATLIEPVMEYGAQVVMGSRFVAPRVTRVFYFWHKMGNKFITLIFNLLHNTTFTDIYSCYLVYERQLVPIESIRTRGWEQHGEILSRAVKGATVLYEVPVSYRGRSYAEGKKIRPAHVFRILYILVLTRIRIALSR